MKKSFDIRNNLSLSAVMFFAPFVHNIINKGHLDLSDSDRDFILGYIKFGYGIISIVMVTLGISILNFFIQNNILDRISSLGIGATILGMIIGVFLVFSKKYIFQSDEQYISITHIENGDTKILISFIPFYNYFIRYTNDFDHPYRWIKESILRWTLFFITTFSGYLFQLSIFILILIILRVATLIGGIDLIDSVSKEKINKLFYRNPEEIRGYIGGFFVHISTLMMRKESLLNQEIINYKNKFMNFNKLDSYIAISEYVIAGIFGIITLPIRYGIYGYNLFGLLMYMPCTYIFVRYAIMIHYKTLVHIPIAYEIVQISIRIYTSINQKFIKKK